MTTLSQTLEAMIMSDPVAKDLLKELLARIETLEAAPGGGGAAADVTVDTSGFIGNLGVDDSDVQAALATIDGIAIGGGTSISNGPGQVTVDETGNIQATGGDFQYVGDSAQLDVTGSTGGVSMWGVASVEISNDGGCYLGLLPAALAAGSVSFNVSVANGDSFTIGSITLTAAASPATENEFQNDANYITACTNAVTALQAHSTYAAQDYTVTDNLAGSIIIAAKTESYAGNDIGTSEIGNSFVSFPMSGGRPAAEVLLSNLALQGASDMAAAETGTLENAPVAGDPALFIRVSINGTYYAIPAWAVA